MSAGVMFGAAPRQVSNAPRRSRPNSPMAMAIRAVESFNSDFALEEKVRHCYC